jgi:hypothetical protein
MLFKNLFNLCINFRFAFHEPSLYYVYGCVKGITPKNRGGLS